MSREILFRGKRTDNGEWVEGYFVKGEWYLDEKEIYALLPLDLCFFPCCEISKWILVDPETVCQYTGMTDKNGREIFEGDILSAHLDDQYPEDTTYVQVTWNGFSWCTRETTEDDVMTEHDCNVFEVCGNIFDNFELLEGA